MQETTTLLWVQDFEDQMRTLIGIESVKKTPFTQKGKESVHSAFFKKKLSQQILCLEKVKTRLLGEDWERFNKRIKAWQSKRGYLGFKNKI